MFRQIYTNFYNKARKKSFTSQAPIFKKNYIINKIYCIKEKKILLLNTTRNPQTVTHNHAFLGENRIGKSGFPMQLETQFYM